VSAAVLLAALLLAGTPNGAGAQIGSANSKKFEWTAPGDDGTRGRATRYELRCSATAIDNLADSTAFQHWWSALSNAVPGMPAPSQAGAVDSVRVSNLAYGTTYYFVIRSVDDSQNWSPYSNVATVTLAPCDAPTSTPDAPQIQADSTGVLLSWDPPQDSLATSVQIYRGPSASKLALFGSVPVGATTTYRDATVRRGSTYIYAFAWSASCGNGPVGNTSSVTIATPNPPATPSVVQGGASMRVYPNPASGPPTFHLQIEGNQPQPVRIRLYDLTGRWIAVLADGMYGPGETLLTWSRQTRMGDPAAPGYYEAIGTIGPTRVRERLVLLP
jgi:hypothetical protein